MRKSTIILTGGLWLLALLNMWLVLQAGEEHARAAEARARIRQSKEPPGSSHTIVIVNAPPDIDTRMSGPSTAARPSADEP
jgi:hypothetical protein